MRRSKTGSMRLLDYDEVGMQQGVEYEQHWVKTHYPNAVAIEPSFGPRLKGLDRVIRYGSADQANRAHDCGRWLTPRGMNGINHAESRRAVCRKEKASRLNA